MSQNDAFAVAIFDEVSYAAASHFYDTHHFETKRYPKNSPGYRDDEADRS